MRAKILLVVFFAAATVAAAARKIEPPHIKLGLWETTLSNKWNGQLPIPAEDLSGLTPEQRAKPEEAMKKAVSSPHEITYKNCVTKEKLNASNPSAGGGCTETILSSTSSKLVLKLKCTDEKWQMSVTLEGEALNTENIKGSGQGSMTSGGHTANVESTYTSKWIGSACGNVE
jgi:hypothetical protein